MQPRRRRRGKRRRHGQEASTASRRKPPQRRRTLTRIHGSRQSSTHASCGPWQQVGSGRRAAAASRQEACEVRQGCGRQAQGARPCLASKRPQRSAASQPVPRITDATPLGPATGRWPHRPQASPAVLASLTFLAVVERTSDGDDRGKVLRVALLQAQPAAHRPASATSAVPPQPPSVPAPRRNHPPHTPKPLQHCQHAACGRGRGRGGGAGGPHL